MAFTQGLCQKLQTTLNRVAGQNAPSLKRDRVGYLEALVSEANTAGVEQIPVPTNGKKRMVQIDYYQRGTEADINGDLGCTEDVEQEPFEKIVSVDDSVSSKGLVFNEDEMRKLCEADDIWVANIVMAQMNAVNTTLNKHLLGLQAANFGNFADGTTAKSVKLFEDGTNASRGIATAQIRHEYDKTAASGAPLIVGGGNFDLFAKVNQIACCNDLGADLSRWTDFLYYYDRFVETEIGAGHFVVLAPGATQLVTWNKYAGNYAKQNDVFTHGTITDPFTGLTYDLKVHYDDCADKWVIKFFLHFTLCFLPVNAFGATDDLNGVNYTFDWTDCSTIEACPIIP